MTNATLALHLAHYWTPFVMLLVVAMLVAGYWGTGRRNGYSEKKET